MPAQKFRVMVVDDEPVIAATLASILTMSGFLAEYFTDPHCALASALVDPPDLLLSDVDMPGLSGIDLALQIKALRNDCKIMLFSGHARSVDFLNDATRLEPNFHIIPKPVHPSDILTAIREHQSQN